MLEIGTLSLLARLLHFFFGACPMREKEREKEAERDIEREREIQREKKKYIYIYIHIYRVLLRIGSKGCL